ncbi:MAG: phytoene desaturase family protein, partial [Candidatus Helarchaeota archaeon]
GGGTGIIPETFWQTMKENNGNLFLGKEGRVTRIVIENDEVKGVEVGSNQDFYEGDIVIANSDIKTTVLKLVGEKYFEKEYVEYIKNLKWGGQVCSLKIAIDIKVSNQKMLTYVPKMEDDEMKAFFTSSGDGVSEIDFSKIGVPSRTALLIVPISNHDPNLAPEGCQNIHTVSPTAFGSVTRWNKEDEKKWEKTCLDTLLTLYPEIDGHIVIQEFISNSILETRFGKEGAGTGTAQSIDQVGKKRPSMISPIKGLYFCSGDAGGWGIGTELPARAALELFEIFKKNNFSNDQILVSSKY